MPLYEFQPSFTVDQTDLTLTSTGSGVHFNKAVTVDLGILDRISGTVSSNAELLANNYVNSISVDILNINGSSEYTNFLTDYKSNIFTFTEYDNINVFGKYTKDFGVRFTLSESSETYTSEFYLYGNLPEFSGIQIQDSTGTTFHSSSESSKTAVNSTGQTGALTSVITFNNDIAYTAFNRVDVYSSSSSSEFASQINPNPIFSRNLTNEPIQSFDINEGSLPSNTPVYLHYVPYANLGSGAAWTVGPYTFEDNPAPTTAFLTTDQSGNFVQDIASVLAVGNSSEVLDFSSNKLVFNVYGSSEDVSRNSVNSFASVILLGTKNKIFGDYDAIVGGTTNVISGDATNPSDFNFIGAGSGNDITGSSYASTIGGYNNDIFSSDYSILGGGYQNLIQDCTAGFIGGGFDNTISAHQSVIAGGVINLITGDGYSFIGGGEGNEIYSIFGSILGGENNIVSGNSSSVLGGESNRIYGSHSFIAGGAYSKVSGDYANAIGRRIQIQDSHDGALVLADGQNRDHNSTIAHSATLDFANGVYINTGNLTVEESITMGGNIVLTGITSAEVIEALGYTPLSTETDDQTLDEVLTQGNTSTRDMSVGAITGSALTIDTDTLHVDAANNRVGIGTDDPIEKLDVRGNSYVSGNMYIQGTDYGVYKDNTTIGLKFEADGDLKLQRSNNALWVLANSVSLRTNNSYALVATDTAVDVRGRDFYVDTDTLYTDAINDRVGVNTDSPEAALHVYSGDAIIGRVGNSSPNSTLTVAGYDDFGLDFTAHSSWTHWKARVGHGRNFELYNDGVSNNNQTLQLGKSNATKNAKVLIFSTGDFMDVGRNSNYPIARFGVDAHNAYVGDFYLDIRSSTTVTDRFEFNRGGEFIASGIGVGYTSPNYELDVSGSGHFLNNLVVDGGLDVTGDITMAGNTVLTGITSGDVTGALGYTPVSVNDTGDFVTSSETGIFITGYTVTEADVTGHQAALTITESQISDLGSYLTGVSESDVTQHEGALTLTSGQITGALGFSPISSETDSQDLNSVLGYGNSSELGISVGAITGSALTIDTDTLFVDSTNNRVGIGTTSPAASLHVYSESSTIPAFIGRLPFKTNANSQLRQRGGLIVDVAEGGASMSFGGIGSTSGGYIQAYQTNSTGTSRPLVLNPFGGFVGIGFGYLQSPTEALDVVGNIKASGTVTASNIGTIAAFEGNQNLRTTDPATFSIAKAQALLPSSAQDLFQLSSNDGTVRFRAGITSGNLASMIIGTQYTSLATAALVVDNGSGNCALFGRGTAYTAEFNFSANIPQFRLQNNGKTFTASVSGNTFRISDGTSPGTNDRLTISSAGDVGVTNLTASGTVTQGSNVFSTFGNGWNINNSQGYYLRLTSDGVFSNAGRPLGTVSNPWGVVTCADLSASGTVTAAGVYSLSTSGIESASPSNATLKVTRNDNINYSAMLNYYSGNSLKWSAGLSDAEDFTGSTGLEYLIGPSKNNPVFLISSSNNVGIGTTTPTEKLEVNGNLKISSIGTGNSASSYDLLFYGTTSTGTQTDQAAIYSTPWSTNSNAGNLIFETSNTSNALAERMRIDGAGNVGIGTAAPNYKLDIAGNVNVAGSQAYITFNAGGSHVGNIAVKDEDGYKLGLQTYNSTSSTLTTKMVLDTNGNVGIGTTSPAYKLEIADDTDSTVNLLRLRNTDTVYSQSWDFQLDTSKDLVITGGSANGGVKIVPGSRGFTVNGNIKTTFTSQVMSSRKFTALDTNGVMLTDSGATNGLSIANGGNATFSHDLTVSGNLTVNGTTTTLNSTTLQVDDKNIELGTVATPTDTTADGGGITLKGATDKTITWYDATDAWTFSNKVSTSEITTASGTLTLNPAGGFVFLPSGKKLYGSNIGFGYQSNAVSAIKFLLGPSIDNPDMRIERSSSNLLIQNEVADGDILFKGSDGGSTITALTLDMSAGGNATFAGSVTATSLIKSGGISSEFLKADGSVDSNTYLTTSSASSTYLPLSGGTMTGNVTFPSPDAINFVADSDTGESHGITARRTWKKTVSAGNLQKLGKWNDTEGTVQMLITVGSETSGNSGTSTYLWGGGFNSFATGYRRLRPITDHNGHGDGADDGTNDSWHVYLKQETNYIYSLSVAVPTGANNKNLRVTCVELAGGNDFTDMSSDSALAMSGLTISNSDQYSLNTVNIKDAIYLGGNRKDSNWDAAYTHVSATNNPHSVTASQVGAYTSSEVNTLLDGKSPTAGSTSLTTVGTIGTGTWQGTVIASAYLDADTAHLSGTQTFSGAKTFSAIATFSGSETNFASGSMLDWANGDARIIEGAHDNNYSLSFQTFDGSSCSTKMHILGNGNVGIGTTSPAAKLHVKGAALRLEEAGAARHLDIVPAVSGSNHRFTSTNTGSGFNFEYWNGSAATVMASIASTGLTVNSGSIVLSGTGRIQGVDTVTNATDAANKAYVDAQVGSADTLQEVTDNGNTTTNSIGIGTTSPTNKLDIRQSSSSGSDVIGTGAITIGSDNPYWTFRGTATSLQDLAFDRSYGGTWYESMRIQRSSGNVGIGTTAPSQKLDVVGNIKASGTVGIGTSPDATHPLKLLSVTQGRGLIIRETDDGNDAVSVLGYNGGGTLAVKTAGVNTFYVDATSSFGNAYFNNSGKFGIGTSSPTEKLEVNGNLKISSIGTGNSASSYDLLFYGTTSTGTQTDQAAIYSTPWSTNSNAGNLIFETSNTSNALAERMRIDGAGNVGIGTAAPNYKLDIAGNVNVAGSEAYITFNAGGSHVGNIAVKDESGYKLGLQTYNSTSSTLTTKMVLDTNGNVGIGTTSPASTLDILGGGLSTQFRVSNTSANSTIKYGAIVGRHYTNAEENVAGMLITSSSSNTGGTVSIGGGISAANAVNNVVFYTAANNTTLTGTERMRISSTGAVVIGETGAAVDGGLTIESYAYGAQIQSVAGSTLQIKASSSTHYVVLGSDIGQTLLRARTANLDIDSNDIGMDFSVGIDKLFVAGASGNVGIGTTTPCAKLEVNGHFAATTKSFIIPNPKKGGRLQYGVVETDEHSVYIRGKSNQNLVELPEEWEWLVDEDSVTVQLTSIGQIQQLFVTAQNNKYIKVCGLANNGEYNYVVYGTRKDVDPLQKNLK
jgi:hypothetical protein